MEPDTRQPDTSTRLRLVDLKVGPERPALHLGGGLAGVLTGTFNRSDAARWIASVIVGPRPEGAVATVDVGGSQVPVESLRSPKLAPGAPTMVDRDLLRAHWRAACDARRDELASAQAASRIESHRLEAALEHAPVQQVEAPVAPAELVSPVAAPERTEAPAAARSALRAEVQSLVAVLDSTQSEPRPECALLADAWDAHVVLVRVRQATDALPAADLEPLEQRVNAARVVVSKLVDVPEAARVKIEECHAAVVAAEEAAFKAKRRERKRTIARYEETVAAELLALADAGIDSYASFLVAVGGGGETALDAAGRAQAEMELAAARAALDDALQVPDVPTRGELDEREVHMRARAAELLGHPAGADPAAELRATLVEPELRAEKIVELSDVLRRGGVEIGPDVLAGARAFLAAPESESPVSAPAAAPDVLPPLAAVPPAPEPDLGALRRLHLEQSQVLRDLELELERVDAVRDIDVARLAAADLVRALESLLDAYRTGQVLAGQLPLVLDGVLDGLSPDARAAAVKLLVDADDVQSIVVSDDPELMQSVSNAGGALVRWPDTASAGRTAASPGS